MRQAGSFGFVTRAGMALCAALAFAAPACAERVRIGILATVGSGPLHIALAKGYFKKEGLDAEIIQFDTAQPMAVSIVTGDLDFGATAFSSAFYNLASQGLIKIVGAQGRDVPGFANNGLVATMPAWESGLRDFKDVKGRVVGVATPGTGPHYCLGLIADKYGFQLADMDVQFLKGSAPLLAAFVGKRIEAAIMPSAFALAAVRDGPGKLVGWIGDMQPWQLGGAFTSTNHADKNPDYVRRFLRAYREGIHDYYDAFMADGVRKDGPKAEEMLQIIAKGIDQPVEIIRAGITYADREARLDFEDIKRQIAWHRKQGLIERDVDVDALLDKRFVVEVPK